MPATIRCARPNHDFCVVLCSLRGTAPLRNSQVWKGYSRRQKFLAWRIRRLQRKALFFRAWRSAVLADGLHARFLLRKYWNMLKDAMFDTRRMGLIMRSTVQASVGRQRLTFAAVHLFFRDFDRIKAAGASTLRREKVSRCRCCTRHG
jgi:hypothetical protein